jgi:hypothetical protein
MSREPARSANDALAVGSRLLAVTLAITADAPISPKGWDNIAQGNALGK